MGQRYVPIFSGSATKASMLHRATAPEHGRLSRTADRYAAVDRENGSAMKPGDVTSDYFGPPAAALQVWRPIT